MGWWWLWWWWWWWCGCDDGAVVVMVDVVLAILFCSMKTFSFPLHLKVVNRYKKLIIWYIYQKKE